MNPDTLKALPVSDLKALCRPREISTTKRSKHEIISLLIGYHQKHKVVDSLPNLKKEQLIIEAKAIGLSKLGSVNKSNLMAMIKNPSKYADSSNTTKSRKSSKGTKRTTTKKIALFQKQQKAISALERLETVLVDIFNGIKDGFQTHSNCAHNLKDIFEFDEERNDRLPPMPPFLAEQLDEFGDKLLVLLPLIMRVKSAAHDWEEYGQKSLQLAKSKQAQKRSFFFALKHYSNKNQYDNDEDDGPFAAVFDTLDAFESWKSDKSVKDIYGKKIAKVKYVQKCVFETETNGKAKTEDEETESDESEVAEERYESLEENDNQVISTEDEGEVSDVYNDENLNVNAKKQRNGKKGSMRQTRSHRGAKNDKEGSNKKRKREKLDGSEDENNNEPRNKRQKLNGTNEKH